MPQRTNKALALIVACLLVAPVRSTAGAHKSAPPRTPTKTANQFVIDPNRPYVYLRFDRIGKGDPRCYEEHSTRVWLRLVNNSRVPISILASGVPEDCPSNETQIMYEVVPDVDSGGVFVEGSKVPMPPLTFPATSLPEQSPPAKTDSLDKMDSEEMPRGYMFDVATGIRVPPGKSIPISLPISHLGRRHHEGKNWHVEIPFEFDLPKGKGPRDPVVGGRPSMVIIYSIWDLPDKYAAEVEQ